MGLLDAGELIRLAEFLILTRRHLHAHPELSFREENTSAYIAAYLDSKNIPYTKGWAGHGIVATIAAPVSTEQFIALRADMDALPITEANDVPYCSTNPGVMHACGHDVHMTCLIGAVEIIHNRKHLLKNDVKFIFQPGEEVLPGGASVLLNEGAIDPLKCKAIFGLHVLPSMEAGKVGFRGGAYMASADEIYLTVIGKGGHAAMPHDVIDPILVASHIVSGLQSIVSRSNDPTSPAVLSIGKINSEGGATNIIPDKVYLEGTFRAMNETWRFKAHDLIRQCCESIARSFGASIELKIITGYPVLINDEALTGRAMAIASDMLGPDNVELLPVRMTSEDFAWYTQQIKACFFRLGTGNKSRGITSGVHTATFDVDESCLVIGAQVLAAQCL